MTMARARIEESLPEALIHADLQALESLRTAEHPRCFACGQGLFRLEFELGGPHCLIARMRFDDFFCGYPEQVHGGAVALFFDQAAACCVFAHGTRGVTAALEIRYREPVRPGEETELRSTLVQVAGPLWRVRLQLRQEERVRVEGIAKMWVQK